MKLSLFLLAAAAQQILASALPVTEVNAPSVLSKRTGWDYTCGQATILPNTTIMAAKCSSGGAGKEPNDHYTELELNNCIYNDMGTLNYGGHSFGGSCRDCRFDNDRQFPEFWSVLKCNCNVGGSDKWPPTSIDTSSHISNIGGNLRCD